MASGTKKLIIQNILVLISLAASIFLLWQFFKDLNWGQFFAQFALLDPIYVFLAVLTVPLAFVVRAMRWSLLLPDNSGFSFRELFDATSMGILGNWLLPLRAGEFVKPWFLSRTKKIGYTTALASVFIERILDVISLLAAIGIFVLQLDSVPPLVTVGAKALGVVGLIGSFMLVFAYLFESKFVALGNFFSRKLVKPISENLCEVLEGMLQDFLGGCRSISSFGQLIFAFMLSLLIWVSMALTYHLGLFAYGYTPGIWHAVGVTVLVAVAVAAPNAPGFLGTFQVGCAVALVTIYGYSDELVLNYSVVMHILQVAVSLLIGLVILKRANLSILSLFRFRPEAA